MRQGLILLAHGARDPRWREPFERLADRVREKRPDVAVSLAFLELMTPDLLAAGEDLVAAGCDALWIVPVFFGQGGHVRDDIPARVDALRRRCPNAVISLGPAAGENAGVIDAVATFSVRELDRGNR